MQKARRTLSTQAVSAPQASVLTLASGSPSACPSASLSSRAQALAEAEAEEARAKTHRLKHGASSQGHAAAQQRAVDRRRLSNGVTVPRFDLYRIADSDPPTLPLSALLDALYAAEESRFLVALLEQSARHQSRLLFWATRLVHLFIEASLDHLTMTNVAAAMLVGPRPRGTSSTHGSHRRPSRRISLDLAASASMTADTAAAPGSDDASSSPASAVAPALATSTASVQPTPSPPRPFVLDAAMLREAFSLVAQQSHSESQSESPSEGEGSPGGRRCGRRGRTVSPLAAFLNSMPAAFSTMLADEGGNLDYTPDASLEDACQQLALAHRQLIAAQLWPSTAYWVECELKDVLTLHVQPVLENYKSRLWSAIHGWLVPQLTTEAAARHDGGWADASEATLRDAMMAHVTARLAQTCTVGGIPLDLFSSASHVLAWTALWTALWTRIVQPMTQALLPWERRRVVHAAQVDKAAAQLRTPASAFAACRRTEWLFAVRRRLTELQASAAKRFMDHPRAVREQIDPPDLLGHPDSPVLFQESSQAVVDHVLCTTETIRAARRRYLVQCERPPAVLAAADADTADIMAIWYRQFDQEPPVPVTQPRLSASASAATAPTAASMPAAAASTAPPARFRITTNGSVVSLLLAGASLTEEAMPSC
ncbi:hypothetical protein CXG81DRAFT_19481 [Caulochytrium protostelioides]|uniref:Uncharacterized protein n=1 Tax=Caulochytrium protostelioides TaxID=1555241 RepID=A0A4P9X634_9FUNG|nr:hypothetical protein CXG81DRAFT_19481 [Caulochytrium protostelioides]|eukprot:RKP00602.1 hypothetical protein CXG81DRAFT_19481 [Caulochytrium protostelioides]